MVLTAHPVIFFGDYTYCTDPWPQLTLFVAAVFICNYLHFSIIDNHMSLTIGMNLF